MDVLAKNTEWRPGPTVCRCCLTEGCYKDISTEYFWMGKREVYAEMLSDTFNVSIAYSQSGGPNSNSRLICEPCISRLRDACDFKRQVAECEKTFMQHLDPGSSSADLEAVSLEPLDDVKLERVKLEKRLTDDEFDDRDFDDDDDDDDMDDEPLTKLASKIPKKETVDLMDLLDNNKAAEKRKSTSKSKASPSKKSKVVKKEPAKASVSKITAKTEKKKKELGPRLMAQRNAEIILRHSTLYPFRLRGSVLICVYCSEGYEDPKHLRRHIDVLHAEFSVSAAFAHITNVNEYLKVDCTNLKCRECYQPMDTVNDVADHIQLEHGIRLHRNHDFALQVYKLDRGKWVCLICKERVATLVKLVRHMTTKHFQKYTCDVCGRTYMSNNALKYHIKCNHSGKFVCRRCWSEFQTAEERTAHLKTSTYCWTFSCIYCGERFLSWEIKNKHLVEKHDLPKVTYTCYECGQVYDNRKYYYSHFQKVHANI